MPTLTIKGIPAALHQRLREQAEANRRSLNAEILVLLERAVGRSALDHDKFFARIHAFHDELARRGIKPVTAEEIQAWKVEGRD